MTAEADAGMRVLLFEDNPADAGLLRASLGAVPGMSVQLEWVDRLRPGLERLTEGGVDLALIDLSLPDSTGLQTFRAVRDEAPDLPLVILTGHEDEQLALTAIAEGAQDYLIKGEAWPLTLARTLRYALARQRLVAELRRLSVVDELTGLHNRRGFLSLGEQFLKVADRNGLSVCLVHVNVDGLKGINDRHGRHRGDDALAEVAALLRRTFRTSDVVGRVGGDDFCALLVSDESRGCAPLVRLSRDAIAVAAGGGGIEVVSLSAVVVQRDLGEDLSLEDLMQRGDAKMRERRFGEHGFGCAARTTTAGVDAGSAARQQCLAAVAAYVTEMRESDCDPTWAGYRRLAPQRGWPDNHAVVREVGSWRTALDIAGVDPGQAEKMPLVSRADCLAAVSAYAAEASRAKRYPGIVGYERDARSRGWPSRSTILKRLGPWREALALIGFEGTEVRRQWQRGPCLAAVRAYVEEMTAAGEHPSVGGYERLARDRGWPNHRTVVGSLGSWRGALSAVGFAVPPASTGCVVGKETCVAALARYVEEAATQRHYPGTKGYDCLARERNWPARDTVVARLGSWANALTAGGYEKPRKLANRVSRDTCVAAVAAYLAETVETGRTPTAAGYEAAAKSRGWPARSTVLRRLGSWPQAITTAAEGGPNAPS